MRNILIILLTIFLFSSVSLGQSNKQTLEHEALNQAKNYIFNNKITKCGDYYFSKQDSNYMKIGTQVSVTVKNNELSNENKDFFTGTVTITGTGGYDIMTENSDEWLGLGEAIELKSRISYSKNEWNIIPDDRLNSMERIACPQVSIYFLPREQRFNAMARKLGEKYWDGKVFTCGDSYYIWADTPLYEFKDPPRYSFQGKMFQPKALSRVEKLNGIDPLPVEWEGSMSVSFSIYRVNSAYYNSNKSVRYFNGWRDWQDREFIQTLKIKREKGVWSVSHTKKPNLECAEIPKGKGRVTPNGSW